MTSEWRSFRLVPEDVLFFRDGKPASIGQDHYLRSLFPPFPSTLYGAIRTRRLLDEGVELLGLSKSVWGTLKKELREELGEWGGFGTLELRGPCLLRDGEVLLPAPADLGVIESRPALVARDTPQKRSVKAVVRFLFAGGEARPGHWSHPLRLAHPFVRSNGRWKEYRSPEDGPEPQPVAGRFLTPQGISTWSQGGVPEPDAFVHADELWSPEVRTGLKLQADSRQAKEHMLYTFGYVRLAKGVSLGFELRGSALEAAGWLRLGGDGRPVRLEPLSAPALPPLSHEALEEGSFLLAFATPTLSESGAYPPGFSRGSFTATLGGLQATLVGGLVRSQALVGGWDLANARAKPLRRAIPAGCVFAFETKADRAAIPSLHGSNVAGFEREFLARQGFGLTIVGAMPRKDA